MTRLRVIALLLVVPAVLVRAGAADEEAAGRAFFEKKIRPLLIKHCYECHSEQSDAREGGLLLDRASGWLQGGSTGKAVVRGEPESSLLVTAVRYTNDELQMPPEYQLKPEEVRLLETWIRRGAPGPANDPGETEFSRVGDQAYLFEEAKDHWAFRPVQAVEPPEATDPAWNQNAIDRFVAAKLAEQSLSGSKPADARTLIRRLTYDLTGLPPTPETVAKSVAAAKEDRAAAIQQAVDRLIDSQEYGEHFARMWLDVARYADTDDFYRPDTKTAHYFPFAFTYRDYVVDAYNEDKPYDRFITEQLAADLMDLGDGAPELAALGFLTVGPHANRNPTEALDDWIDVTTRGLMGLTAACARCHDHKYEPIPTADYYSLHGVFASIVRVKPLDEENQPLLTNYRIDPDSKADYEAKRAEIDAKLEKAKGKKSRGNNRAVTTKIRETELAELLLFHPGAPVHTMVVKERGRPVEPYIQLRGDPTAKGESVPRRFLRVLDPEQEPFSDKNSGRLDLAQRIASPDNPLTARVFVNRVWGYVVGRPLVETPSDFGLQGARPTHPELLDWLADDFTSHGWSVKRLVRKIVLSRTYQQRSGERADAAAIDPANRLLWRAERKHLSIEEIRDSLLAVAGRLDHTPRGRAAPLWGKDYTRRRAIYGYVNRFNLDPTLRAFDFPTPMQTQPGRDETIVAPQALFAMNSPFVIDQATAITESPKFSNSETDEARVRALFEIVFQREPAPQEVARVVRFVQQQQRFFGESEGNATVGSPWPLAAQALLMSNEFQYID